MFKKIGLLLGIGFLLQGITGCSKEANTKASGTSKETKKIELSEPIDLPEAGTPELNYMSVADYNGDNKLDLIVGNFAGELAVKINSGTKEAPSFKAKENLKVNGENLKITHW